ncbi:MAG: hypothetical protein HN976_11835 [Lentisphaerae bacterium]|nr:hypothetical protein [Lentisphaerota bacterium]
MSMCFLLLAILVPVGAVCFLVFARKRRWCTILGAMLLSLFLAGLTFFYPVLPWAFDSLTDWELRLSAEIPGHTVTLVQKPGFDFYNSSFQVTRLDGKMAKVLIDGDDDRWWNPEVVHRSGRIYFVRGSGQIGERTSYVDPKNDIIFSGYSRRTHKISGLEFN